MQICRYSFACAAASIALASATTAGLASEAARHATEIGPYLDEQTIVVAHVDVSKIDVDVALKFLTDAAALGGEAKEGLAIVAAEAKTSIDRFQKAGGRDVYAALSISDIGRPDTPKLPFFFVIPIPEESSLKAIQAAVPMDMLATLPFELPIEKGVRIPHDGPLVLGSAVTLERLGALVPQRQPANRHLADALQAVDGSAMQILFLPSEDHRRVVREMFPKLPAPLDAIDGSTLADGVLWEAVGIDLVPELQIRSVVQGKDPPAAERLAAAWKQLLNFAASEPTVRKRLPIIDQVVAVLQPAVDGDRMVVTMKQDSVGPIVRQLVMPTPSTVRMAQGRFRRSQQFKQLGLAMHNWADSHRLKVDRSGRHAAFPPAAIHGADGKPLLSWRVAVLPYLDEQALYDQFRLDEPWDSENNKQLIERMPDVFKDRELAAMLNVDRPPPGYTTYVVPVGEGLVFGRQKGTVISEITDGMSNTILIIEVVPEQAVPWTKPADWQVGAVRMKEKTWEIIAGDPLQGVKRSDRDSFTVARCDGSVHSVQNDIDPSLFWRMLTRAGGEPLEAH